MSKTHPDLQIAKRIERALVRAGAAARQTARRALLITKACGTSG
jgi:hypothetical protein